MSRMTYVSILVAIIVTGLAFVSFQYAVEDIFESIGISLLLSSPIITFCVLFYYLSIKNKNFKNSLLYSLVLGGFIFCAILHLGFNSIMTLDVMSKGSFGPAQGYWILINIFGAIIATVWGAIFGIIAHVIYKKFFKGSSS